MPLVSSFFTYYTDGNTVFECNPLPPHPDAIDTRPYVVRIRGDHYIPINVIVFARDQNHAVERVQAGLKECAEKDYRTSAPRQDKYGDLYWHRAVDIIKDMADGKLEVLVERFDERMICKVQWASNGGL